MTNIGQPTFAGCSGLTSVAVPKNVKVDMEFLQRLGCSPEAKNVFGISPALMMRWME